MSAQPNASSAWFKKAEGDLFGADAIQKSSDPSSPHWDLVLFLAHQSVEKYLKGSLATQQIPIPRTHDLPGLFPSGAVALGIGLRLSAQAVHQRAISRNERYPRITSEGGYRNGHSN